MRDGFLILYECTGCGNRYWDLVKDSTFQSKSFQCLKDKFVLSCLVHIDLTEEQIKEISICLNENQIPSAKRK